MYDLVKEDYYKAMDINMDIFSFTADGKEVDGSQAIFPICEQMRNGEIKYHGTGFFISNNGLFVTAKHVLEDTVNPFIVHFQPNNTYYLRSIASADLTHRGDLAVGMLQEMKNSKGEILENMRMLLSSYIPYVTEVVSTYAYPDTKVEQFEADGQVGNTVHINPNQYSGIIARVVMDGIERITPSPLVLCTIESLPGNSGGPVFSLNSKGGVIGINTAGMTGAYHVVSLIDEIRGLKFDNVKLGKEAEPSTVTVDELIKLGYIGTI